MRTENTSADLRIGYLSTTYHTSFIIKGLAWIEQKLNLRSDWKIFGGGPGIVDALEKKELDLGYIGLPPTMIGIARGVRIKCIAGGHVEGTVLVGKDKYKTLEEFDGDMESTLRQFKGKTLGSPPRGSIHDVILRNCISSSGLGDAIKVKNYDWADFIPDAMMEGEIEGAAGTPPLGVLCARVLGAKLVIPPEKLWRYNPSYGIVAQGEFIEERPEVIEGFLKLHEDAANLIRLQPERAAKVVARLVKPIDKTFADEVYRVSPKYCASLPEEYISSTMRFVPVLRELNYIKQDLTRDDIFDLGFINKIHREPSHYEDPGELIK